MPGVSKTNGTQVKLYDCNGGSNQQWNYTSGRQLTAYAGTKCLTAAARRRSRTAPAPPTSSVRPGSSRCARRGPSPPGRPGR
ncbi:ricin-type beta-trefoil lectin domain protein [Phytohabitans kaempferiae]|uniref:Ricin-type beta-trefoil lectin domain protein n=1 Tax=Phytohabitans kaempferiae TaxID=1620943 RepID=A0ABV6M211_9ACTN